MDVLERDFYEERRRKWRRSAFWRGFLVAAVIAVIIGAITGADDLLEGRGDHIARFAVNGIFSDSVRRERLLAELAEAENAKAVVLRINSGGGTAAGAEALYASIREIAETKPVVAVLGEVAASGAYIAALGTDHIVGRGNSLVGSIGVIMEYPDLTVAMERLGIGMETIRSSELKAEPSPFRPTNPAARARDEAMVAESYQWFRDLVGERRSLSGTDLDEVANGGVFTGRVALDNALIDEIGGETEAIAWLESREAGLADLPVRDWQVETEDPVLERILGRIGSTSGILREISLFQGAKLYSIGP